MSTKIKYAQKPNNTWVYRRTYPKALQPVLGTALKQSLKTSDAKLAKLRVTELNQTYDAIIQEAQANVALQLDQTADPIRVAVPRPRYRQPCLLGDQLVRDLATRFMAEQADRLRPGSFKAVHFACVLLVSHLGAQRIGEISRGDGTAVARLLGQLSPNIRKYTLGKTAALAELVALSAKYEPGRTLTEQTQARILKHMQQFLDWCVDQGELAANPWVDLRITQKPDVHPHGHLTDDQLRLLLGANDREIGNALLFGLLTGMRSGEICGLMAEDILHKGNLGRFVWVRPNAVRQLKSKAAQRQMPLHNQLEHLLDHAMPSQGRLFPRLCVDRIVKAYARLRQDQPALTGTVFHSTRKWFITQCERTGVPEHFTASLVGHHSARSANRLTYGLYSAGISDAQKRDIVDRVRLPEGLL